MTPFGTGGNWGITAETGLIILSNRQVYENDEDANPDVNGDDAMLAFFNERINTQIEALVPSSTPWSGTLAASFTHANAPVDHLIGATTGGTTLVKSGLTREQGARQMESISIPTTYYPAVS